ncbi:hypothetical protein KAJ83_10375 [Marivibrio halodurans]|uniref:Uncharacterized protein n=1 Tax=Marivibrio halodurans TaxID=2039722 RepID=A0A8J7S2K2_9PROT|nr:hypothetical protein [Marivibrio halodurans]MBP5857413.1 hypothetical protein [Marivibrio halodurans]
MMDTHATNKTLQNTECDTIPHYRKSPIFLHYSHRSCIKVPYYESFCNFIFRRDIMSALQDTFEAEHKKGISRRAMLSGLSAVAGAAMLASLPGGNDAQAGEAKAATLESSNGEVENTFDTRRELRHYSEDSETRGVGVFINLQENAPWTGDEIGKWIKNQFAGVGVPVEYRVNQSQGTATDITLYAGGYDFTINIAELKHELPRVYAHHQDIWNAPDQVSLNNQQPQ